MKKKTLKQWTVFTFDIAYIEHYKRDCWKICKFHCFHFFWLLATSYKKVNFNRKISLGFVKIFAISEILLYPSSFQMSFTVDGCHGYTILKKDNICTTS